MRAKVVAALVVSMLVVGGTSVADPGDVLVWDPAPEMSGYAGLPQQVTAGQAETYQVQAADQDTLNVYNGGLWKRATVQTDPTLVHGDMISILSCGTGSWSSTFAGAQGATYFWTLSGTTRAMLVEQPAELDDAWWFYDQADLQGSGGDRHDNGGQPYGACIKVCTMQANTGWIYGTVTQGGQPLGFVTVEARKNGALWGSQQTNAQGQYTIHLLPPGAYALQLHQPGMWIGTAQATVTAGAGVQADIAAHH